MSLPHWETIGEVIILTCVNYAFIRHLQTTRGGGLLAGFIVVFLVAVGVLALFLSRFDIPHLRLIAEKALPSLGVALLVIFQPELRFAISRIGNTRLVRATEHFFGGEPPQHAEKLVDSIVLACQRMSKRKIGALIAVQNNEGIAGFNQSGTLINADVSAPLIETIFYKGSPLHDGALLIVTGRAMWAGCHLPLSEQGSLKRHLGTRHCAALGLAENSDALVIVVSEETGRISVARNGDLIPNIGISELREYLTSGIEAQLKRRTGAEETETVRALTTSQIRQSAALSDLYDSKNVAIPDQSTKDAPR